MRSVAASVVVPVDVMEDSFMRIPAKPLLLAVMSTFPSIDVMSPRSMRIPILLPEEACVAALIVIVAAFGPVPVDSIRFAPRMFKPWSLIDEV